MKNDGTVSEFHNQDKSFNFFILAMIASAFLPETLGMPMTQTMEEAENNYYK